MSQCPSGILPVSLVKTDAEMADQSSNQSYSCIEQNTIIVKIVNKHGNTNRLPEKANNLLFYNQT